MKIFFSWSGHLSKKVAKTFKPWLIEKIFPGNQLEIFISEEDIEYGSEWYQSIKEELNSSDFAIIFLTPDNMNASWLNFEAGAIAIGETSRPVITFLLDVPTETIKSPLKLYQCFKISSDTIRKLIIDLKKIGKFESPVDAHLDVIIEKNYPPLEEEINKIKHDSSQNYIDATISIFPEHITSMKKDKIFIGSPMASIKDEVFQEMRSNALDLKNILENECGFQDVYYPAENINNSYDFDGKEKAILNDFKLLKESEHYVFIYPKKVTSSILMEMGYAIALSKNTLIFTHSRKSLPYMLQEADKAIPNIRIYEYKNFSEVIKRIRSNGAILFTRKGDL